MVLYAVCILFLIVIIIFSFPQFSPIPYFPSNGKDMPLIQKALNMKENQIIVDLGAGDGVVIFHAASLAYKQKLNTQFVAVEINPVLLLVLHIRRLFHPNRKNIAIMQADMFMMSYSFLTHRRLVTFYMYISPWFIEKTINNIAKNLKAFDVVSYFYQVKVLPTHAESIHEGVHKVFSYRMKS